MSQSKPKSSKGTSQTNQPASAGGGSGSTNNSTQSKNGGSPRTNLASNNSAMVPTTVNYLVDKRPASLSLTAMPVLKDTSNTHYSEWKEKLGLYFDRNVIQDLVNKESSISLKLHLLKFGAGRTFVAALQDWFDRQQRVYATIRTATQESVGLQLFRDLAKEANENGTDASQLLLLATRVQPAGSPPADDPASWSWLSKFKHGNASYLWAQLNAKYGQYNGYDKMRLYHRYNSFPKYKEGEDPTPLLNDFEDTVYQMELAGLSLPPDIHWATWLQAIPDSIR